MRAEPPWRTAATDAETTATRPADGLTGTGDGQRTTTDTNGAQQSAEGDGGNKR